VPVAAARHEPVHEVVARRDAAEHGLDAPRVAVDREGAPVAERAGRRAGGRQRRPPSHGGNRVCVEAQRRDDLADDVIDCVLQRLRPRVEAGHRRQHDRAGLGELEQPAQVDPRERRLARHDHERPPLLERHVADAVDERARGAEGDMRHRRHRARADHGGVGEAAAAGRRRREVVGGVHLGGHAGPLEESGGHGVAALRRQLQLVLEHKHAAVGHAELQLASRRRQRLDEAQHVRRATGAAHADEHGGWRCAGHTGPPVAALATVS